MIVNIIKLSDASDHLYNQFYLHNCGYDGTMRNSVATERANKKSSATVFYIEERDEVIAWALLHKRNTYSTYSRRRSCAIFTTRNNRGRGLGSKLVEAVSKYARQSKLYAIYYPGYNSISFFNKAVGKDIISKRNLCNWGSSKEYHNI